MDPRTVQRRHRRRMRMGPRLHRHEVEVRDDLVPMTAMKRAQVRSAIAMSSWLRLPTKRPGPTSARSSWSSAIRTGPRKFRAERSRRFYGYLKGRRFYPFRVAEKGFVTIRMKVTATPGHGSMPRSDTAILPISELITRIVRTPMRRNVSPVHAQDARRNGRVGGLAGPAVRADACQHRIADDPVRRLQGQRDSRRSDDRSRRTHAAGRRSPSSFMAELCADCWSGAELRSCSRPRRQLNPADTPLFDLIKRTVEGCRPRRSAQSRG